jgi:cytidylate kinase
LFAKEKIYTISIDGPAGSGKGTVAKILSEQLGLHYLDSGAIYRMIALAALHANLASNSIKSLLVLIKKQQIEFKKNRAYLNGTDVTDKIRTEQVSKFTSKIAVHRPIRTLMLNIQRNFLKPPGLVAEGRDMATVVFPNSTIKIYLNATQKERANRRYKQLITKGNNVNLADLTHEIELRDKRDSERQSSPLKVAADAHVIETDNLSIEQTVETIMKLIE